MATITIRIADEQLTRASQIWATHFGKPYLAIIKNEAGEEVPNPVSVKEHAQECISSFLDEIFKYKYIEQEKEKVSITAPTLIVK